MTDRISYKPTEIPDVTGVALTRVRDAIASGELPVINPTPKRQVVMHTDLLAWLESLRATA